MKNEFNGKAIYTPKGKAKEYSQWACNLYVGCSNGCTYCYLKKGIGKATLGGDIPTLKKCFKDSDHAIEVFEKELLKNKEELQKHGLFFSFTIDPMLNETEELTYCAIDICCKNDIPVKILTKKGRFAADLDYHFDDKEKIAVGFTLTGHDELEPNASTNIERIKTMRKLKAYRFKTFASIEPIIDFASSLEMIEKSTMYCDFFMVGLESGKKYDKKEAENFINKLTDIDTKFYIKESLRKLVDYEKYAQYFVEADYNLFEN